MSYEKIKENLEAARKTFLSGRMGDSKNIMQFAMPAQKAIALVRLSDSFCEQTGRELGLEGKLRGFDSSQENIAMIDVGEQFAVRVHIFDYEVIG